MSDRSLRGQGIHIALVEREAPHRFQEYSASPAIEGLHRRQIGCHPWLGAAGLDGLSDYSLSTGEADPVLQLYVADCVGVGSEDPIRAHH